MDFFDDEPRGPSSASGPRQAGTARRQGPDAPAGEQPFLARRLIALGAGVVILILLVLAVRAFLDARKERAFEDYNRDLTALTVEADQLSDGFFERLGGGDTEGSELAFESEVHDDRGLAQRLADRARGLDAPSQLSEAHAGVVLAFELRREALAAVAEQIPLALADDQGRTRAIRRITRQMEVLLASDVLYERARDQILNVIAEEEIDRVAADDVPRSRFLPSGEGDPTYTDEGTIEQVLRGAAVGIEPDDGLVRGTAIAQVRIGGVVAEEGVPATVPADTTEVEVDVQNQGEVEASGLRVEATIGDSGTGGSGRTEAIPAGETGTVTIELSPAPAAGESVQLTVEVELMPGEQVEANNVATYTVTFGE